MDRFRQELGESGVSFIRSVRGLIRSVRGLDLGQGAEDFGHFLQRKPQRLHLLEDHKTVEIILRIHPEAAVHPRRGEQQADIVVVAA